MPAEYWKRETRADAERAIEELMNPGKPHEWLRAPAMAVKLRALAATASRRWPSGEPLRWASVRDAINRCIASGKRGLASVEEALDEMWAEVGRRRSGERESWRVVIGVDLLPGSGVTLPLTVVAAGLRFEVRAFTTPEECFGRPAAELDLSVRLHTAGDWPPTYALVEVSAMTAEEALNEAMEAFYLWRSILNFACEFASWNIQFVPMARARVPAPRWAAALSEREQVSPVTYGGASLGSRQARPREITGDKIALASSILETLERAEPPSSTRRLVLEGFSLFGLALDQEEWHQATLVLWQLAEHLTVIDGSRERHDEICRRLPLMQSPDCRHDPGQVAAALRGVMQIRHGIVHRAAFGAAFDDDVAFLQDACTEALWWLFRRHDLLPEVEHLRLYFQHATATDLQVERVRHVLEVLPKLRQRASGGTASPGERKHVNGVSE